MLIKIDFHLRISNKLIRTFKSCFTTVNIISSFSTSADLEGIGGTDPFTPPPPTTQTHTVVDYPEPSFEIHVPPRKTLSLRPPTPPKKYSGSAHEDLFSSILEPID